MLTLHVEGSSVEELREKVARVLGTIKIEVAVPAAPEAPPAPEPEGKKPGRPRKSAPAPEAPAVPPTAKPSVSEPQAQVGNSASGGSAAPAEATPPSSAPAAPPKAAPAAGDVTFDDMKAKLQAVAAKREGDKDDNDGLARAAAIIGKYGYRKIKEVQPKDFAAIVADCEKA